MAGRIYKQPFAQVPEWLLDSQISDRAIRVFAVLDRHADKDGRAFPGRPKLATRVRCSPSSLDRALDELKAVGAIQTTARYREDGSRSSNDYWLWPSSPTATPLPTGDEGGLTTDADRASPPANRQERESVNESQVNENLPVVASDNAGQLVKGYIDWCDRNGKARPARPAMVGKVVSQLLAANHPSAAIKRALTTTTAFTLNALEFELRRATGSGGRRTRNEEMLAANPAAAAVLVADAERRITDHERGTTK